MISFNDYLYDGNTVLKILHQYYNDLKDNAKHIIDHVHCDFIMSQIQILEHNDFLTSQSQRIRELYKYMAQKYPYLAFTFKGRIKSAIRAEEKFNGYIVEYYEKCYEENKAPDINELVEKLSSFRDLVAYRIVISMPKCHVEKNENKKELELKHLYEIANILPEFLRERGFQVIESEIKEALPSSQLDEKIQNYFRDYINNPKPSGYQSLHITLFDEIANCYIELQLRTKEMDDQAEIGAANHFGYEEAQKLDREGKNLPKGENLILDEAREREYLLQNLDLSKVDVSMFGAINNYLINDGCGLFRGRLILPFEHLSRFQNDIID